ncbi:outer membrane beta-barrel protein [uncultured Ferrimonas sp.]|uniref:outer membrane beta-barrel protein n=1 Tax=uncultured Ferrimonas sp. TaxID=432640 RepID=UPI002619D58D|nr:outer membrane beta-barrel protein [uncultured Ferrimonas sp.]
MKQLLPALLVVSVAPAGAAVLVDAYQPASVNLSESWKMTPQVDVGVGFDDNTAHSSANEVDSWFWRIAPELLFHAGNDTSRYEIDYRLVDGHYFSSDEDDYTDHALKLGLEHHFTRRHRIEAFYNYRREHEARGEGITETRGLAVDTVAKLDVQDAAIIYGFGVPSARINLDFELGYYDKEYTNLRAISQFRDYDTTRARVTMYWRLGAKTKLIGEWNGYNTEFARDDADGLNRDSFDQQIFTGIRWEATSKTSGTIKLGYETRDFDSSGRTDFDGFAWKIGMDWKPRSYSVFSLESGSRTKDPDTLGDFVEEDSYRVMWNHKWRERLSTSASISYTDETFTGFDREDELLQASVGITLAWKRWLASDFTYQIADQDSTREAAKYDKNLFLATVRISL